MIAESGGMAEDGRVRVSVVMPVYNEEATLEAIVRRVKEVAPDVELVAVDDGSADASASILDDLRTEGLVDRVFLHDRNRGKGAALSTGFRGVSGDVVIIQDADLEYDPADYPRLLEPILSGRADVVYGSRFMGGQAHRVLYYWHYVGNQWLTRLSNMVTNLNLTDMETCQKLVRRELLQSLPLTVDRFGIEPEITARLAQARARICEMPVSYDGRSYAEGKKIGWKDGVSAIWFILRCNLLGPKARPWEAPRPAWLEEDAEE